MPRRNKNIAAVDNELGGVPPEVRDSTRKILSLINEDVLPPSILDDRKLSDLVGTASGSDEKIRITVLKDHTLDFPELYLDVFVHGPAWEEPAFAQLFARSKCKKAKSVLESDLVIFTGGEDVDPLLYGEVAHSKTFCNKRRDDDDMSMYIYCIENGIPMLGICRGAQFLHVMNGGKLYQDIDNHQGDHSMWDVQMKKRIDRVSSVHHQSAIPGGDGFTLIATSAMAKNRWRNPTQNDIGIRPDVEAFFYRDTCCLGIQGHPEYAGYNYFAKWTMDTIQNYISNNPDFDWIDRKLRMRPEVMAERDAKVKKGASALI